MLHRRIAVSDSLILSFRLRSFRSDIGNGVAAPALPLLGNSQHTNTSRAVERNSWRSVTAYN
jgi:hypothetical protein